jgi:subtilisin-like proprotein convertase family protein
MKRALALIIVLIGLLLLSIMVLNFPMGAAGSGNPPGGGAGAQRPPRTGADEATRVARDPARVMLQIAARSGADRRAAQQIGTIVEDYGSMVIVAATAPAAQSARQNPALDVSTLETTIELRGFSFDPLVEDPAKQYEAAGGYRQSAEGEGDYYLVQFVAPARDEWLEEIGAAGGQVLQYVPNQAFFVYASSEAIATIARHPRVRWTGAFHPVYKLSPDLRERVYGNQPRQADRSGNTEEPMAYDIAIFKREDLGLLDSRVTTLGATTLHRIILPGNYFNVLQVTPDPAVIKQITQLPGVIAVDPYYKPVKEDERAAQVVAGNYSSVTSLNPPGYNSLAQFGVDGTNVTVAVDDDGVGIPGDGGFYITAGNTVNGPLRGATAGAQGHGHLNATIIAGDLPFSTLDPLGYNYGLGVARKAHIVNIPGLRAGYTGTSADRVNDAVTTAGPNGVFSFISNNSWGAGLNGNAYDSFAAQFDGFVRDASAAATIDPLLVVFSCGNSGQDGLTRPKVSKNTIAVANAENIRTELSATANNIDEMASSSSRGPAADGRIKPDITAPGTAISGGRSGPDVLFGNIDAAHRWSSGTSHAAPQIAGAAALFTQFWKNNNGGVNPSPAIVKAALINGAVEMNAFGTTVPIPNRDEGWGRLNLQNVLNTGTPIRYVNQTVALSNVGEMTTFTGTVATSAKHFRATLVWTDPPGVSDPALVNNLDLEVVVGGTLYKGNVFAGGQSVTGGPADTRNNVENVFLPAGIPAGTQVSIRVKATALNGDGILGNADLTDQHFGLVGFNFTETPVAAIAGVGSALTAESCTPPNSAIDPGETVTVNFSLQNLGAVSTTNVVATLQPTGGVTSPSGPQSYGALTAGGAAVSRAFTFTASGVCNGALTASLNLQDGATNLGTATFSFTLGAISGTPSTFSYTGPPAAIPDANAAGVNVPLTVSGFTGRIADLNFRIDGTACNTTPGSTTVGVDHSFVGDLTFKLTSPAGTTITFISRPGGVNNGGNNFCQVLLDDDASVTSISAIIGTGSPPAGPPYTGTFRPQSPFSAFDGQDPNGTWTLNVSDAVAPDSGFVRAFSLIITGYTCCSGGAGCTLTCPSNIVTNTAPGQCSAAVTYPAPTVSGTCGTVTCNPPSGSTFQKGVTTVNCTSSTGGGSCSFTVTVNDNQAPTITCPANVTVTSPTPTVVTYPPPTVSDNCPNVGAPVCTPPSGSTFPLGTTTVNCNVSDASGNSNSCSFTVTVTPGGGGCPTVSGLNPSSGAVGSSVIITGANFTGVTAVKFSNNVPALFTVNSATQITATVPSGAVTGPITISKTSCPDVQTPSFTVCSISPTTLAVDDGSFESSFGFATGPLTASYVNRLTPSSYPATLNQVSVYFPAATGMTVGASVNIIVGTNPDGDTIINGSITQTVSTTISALNQFNTYPVAPVTINSGDFVVGFSFNIPPTGAFPAATDTTAPHQGRSYLSTDGTTFSIVGSAGSPRNNGIRAIALIGSCCANPTTLSVDDGTAEVSLGYPTGVPTSLFVNRLTPGSYPATLSSVLVNIDRPVGTSIAIVVGTNPDGDANINGSITQTISTTLTGQNTFVSYPVTPVTITSGDFVVGFQITPLTGTFPANLDETPPSRVRSYSSADGTTFATVDSQGFPGNLLIRANVCDSGGGLQYYPLPRPIRLFDTRAPIPGFAACAYLNQPLLAGQELARAAAGVTCDGITIPANARAIVGNATVTGPTGDGFITLFPDGQPRPPVSNLNYVTGQTVPNAFTVGLGANGMFRTYSVAATHFIVDVTGYFAPPGAGGLYYHPLPRPIRLFDTRAPIPGFAACEYLNQPLVANMELAKQARVTCDGITIPADAAAIVGNATVTGALGDGFITLFPNGQPRPPVSNLNYVTGQTVPNAFTVGLGSDGQFRTYSVAGTHFIVDITGYYSPSPSDANGAGLLYNPLPRPIRLFDTRAPIPGFAACEYLNQPLVANAELAKQARITCDGITIPAAAQAVVGNATVTGALGGGFITLFPNGQPRPPVSNLNYVTGQTVPNAFTVGLGSDGQFRTYSLAGTHFIVDLTGYFAP